RASGAVRASRLAALAWSKILRTAFLSCVIIDFLEGCGGSTFAPPPRVCVSGMSNYFLRSQRGDIGGGIAEFRQDLVGVLAQQRRARDHGRAVAHLDGVAHRE